MINNLIVTIVALALAIIGMIIWNRLLSSEKKKLDKDNDELINKIKLQSDELDTLRPYKACVDADAKAKEIISEAQQEALSMIEDARVKCKHIYDEAEAQDEINKSITRQARDKANDIIEKANEKVKNIEAEADQIMSLARAHGDDIIGDAEAKAQEILGDAYELAKEKQNLKKVVVAMRNRIEGYGDEYLKPTDSVLDGLAEDFAYTDAGQKLSIARSLSRLLRTTHAAAKSDYAETARKDTAVNFILDAFDGKVESILSEIKTNNVGKLHQKIVDAYILVNRLGTAFRNTHITEEYLNARLHELRWAVACVALKEKEREEQRRIKERIREEERARREYEKAIRDAEKQEEAIRKAIQKATAQLEKANEEQRAKYEEQLLTLQSQLSEAEAKNQRALSMAQQTRSGHVYIISNIGSFGEDVFKIGMTRRLEPNDRVRELGDASVPFPFDVHAMIFSEDAPALETELHKIFARNQVNKVNPRKEFFRLSISEIKEYLDKKNIDIQWTMLAEAAQYRETLALEKSFIKNAELEQEWVRSQDNQIDFDYENDDEDVKLS